MVSPLKFRSRTAVCSEEELSSRALNGQPYFKEKLLTSVFSLMSSTRSAKLDSSSTSRRTMPFGARSRICTFIFLSLSPQYDC